MAIVLPALAAAALVRPPATQAQVSWRFWQRQQPAQVQVGDLLYSLKQHADTSVALPLLSISAASAATNTLMPCQYSVLQDRAAEWQPVAAVATHLGAERWERLLDHTAARTASKQRPFA